MKRYYFDHSATTPVDHRVTQAMTHAMEKSFGNPSSMHSFGREARVLLEEAREKVARLLNADPAELYFTSGGTEADNTALLGVMLANRDRGDHLITSKIEHHAILDTAKFLESEGFRVSYVSPDRFGVIHAEEIERAIVPGTVMVSVMSVNNETGSINPMAEIGRLCRHKGVLLHTDAVQAFGKVPIDVQAQNVDLLSLSGHKIYGPKGIGVLFVRRGIKLTTRTFGGHQERGTRTGTENLPGAVGLAVAATLSHEKMESEKVRLTGLRDRLWDGLNSQLQDIHLNGHPTERLPGINNISFEGVEGEALLLSLDLKGIAASTGSACSSGQVNASHVLLSMGIEPDIAQSSIRFSMGRENDDESVDYASGSSAASCSEFTGYGLSAVNHNLAQSSPTVAVAMSGGVDSSVAAALLIRLGYQVVGLTMKLFNPESAQLPSAHRGCCNLDAIFRAQAVCQTLNIPHYSLDFIKEFEEGVIQDFIGEYLSGRTPNPCVRCNTLLKWGLLFDKAKASGLRLSSHRALCSHCKDRGRNPTFTGFRSG